MYPKPRRIEIKEIIKYFFNFIIQQITKKTFAINSTGTAILTIVKIGTVFGDMKGSRQDMKRLQKKKKNFYLNKVTSSVQKKVK